MTDTEARAAEITEFHDIFEEDIPNEFYGKNENEFTAC